MQSWLQSNWSSQTTSYVAFPQQRLISSTRDVITYSSQKKIPKNLPIQYVSPWSNCPWFYYFFFLLSQQPKEQIKQERQTQTSAAQITELKAGHGKDANYCSTLWSLPDLTLPHVPKPMSSTCWSHNRSSFLNTAFSGMPAISYSPHLCHLRRHTPIAGHVRTRNTVVC